MASPSQAQRAIVRETFGGTLSDTGRGLLVGLELLAILRGTLEYSEDLESDAALLPTNTETVTCRLISHDFARRMPVVPSDLLQADEYASLDGENTRPALAALVEGLTVPRPGTRGIPTFKLRLLYPYVGELIHYDAVDRRGKLQIERYNFRGGGGLAHKILRTDPDLSRLAESRAGLFELIRQSNTPLGRLAAAMHSHDKAPPKDFEEDMEATCRVAPGGDKWAENLRQGVRNIVCRTSVPRARRVEHLLHWVPYCIARYQLDAAQAARGDEPLELLVDLRARPNTIRRQSQQLVNRSPLLIAEALRRTADRLADETDDEQLQQAYRRFAEQGGTSGSELKSTRSFFTSTMFGIGGLNAGAGIRHFTFKLPLIEALVSAALEPGQEMSFTEFSFEILFKRFGLVLDEKSGRHSSVSASINTAEFEENADVLARQLSSLGLMTAYSDATRMVRAEVSS